MQLFFISVLCFITSASPSFRIVVDVSNPSNDSIAPNFIGFSIEVPNALGMIGEHGNKTSYAQLLRNLFSLTKAPHPGPILRIGGNSADESCFIPPSSINQVHTDSDCKFSITAEQLNAYANFATGPAKDINLSYVIDTNFGLTADPFKVAVGHIQALASVSPALYPHIYAIEVGNEMDIYASHDNITGKPHHRNTSYNFSQYEQEFGTFVKAYLQDKSKGGGGVPKYLQPIIQAGTFASSKWCGTNHLEELDDYLVRFGRYMKTFSWHKYPTTHCSHHGIVNNVTIANLLSAKASQLSLSSFISPIARCKKGDPDGRPIPFWIGEGNSCSCGGMPGVSDTFASALWVLDFLPTASKMGVSGMNFHGGPHGIYPAIAYEHVSDTQPQVRPLYYGLWMFSTLVANYSKWLPSNTSIQLNGDPLCLKGVKSSNVCCLASCGRCGGEGCDKLPGGADNCCSGHIKSHNISCDVNKAPCVIDNDYTPEIIAHSALSQNGDLRVLVIAKSLAYTSQQQINNSMEGSVCPISIKSVIVPHRWNNEARLLRLSAKSNATARYGDGITFAGQTLDGSPDGIPLGKQVFEKVTKDDDGCFKFSLSFIEAVLLIVQPQK